MADYQKTRAQEQKHLDGVISKIKTTENKLQKTMSTATTDIHGIDRTFGDDVHIGTGDDSISIASALSIHQQQQMLAERNNSWQRSKQELGVLEKLQEKPYFARVDFRELPNGKPETIYIGLGSVTDKNDHFLVYDWRAPISSIYYDGDLGKISYKTPDGQQEVNVSLKRQFIIADGKIKTMIDTNETIGDQMLLETLNGKSGTKMKGIVTTIQKEQDQIIRDTDSDLLFVQGAAGSGKTSAIMQRVAYLLYRYRKKLTSGQVLMFSPNMLFNDYIGNVLPEMGEQNMVQMTYLQYVARRLPHLKVQDLFNQFQQTLDVQQAKIAKFITDIDFFQLESNYAKVLGTGGVHFRDIMFRGKVFISKEKIAEVYFGFGPQYKLINRIDGTREYLLKTLNRRISSEMRKKWVQELMQSLGKEDLQKLYDYPDQEFKSGDEEERFIARKLVLAALRSVYLRIHRNNFINIDETYREFLQLVPQLTDLKKYGLTKSDWQAHIDQFDAGLKQHQISMNDISPYLYLYDLVTGHHGDLNMKFVFVDEIQDYTPFQLAYLKYNFPRARYTMLGDLNQSIFIKDSSNTLLQETSRLFDPDKTRVVQLTHSYRSTKPITDFTKHLLVAGEKIVAFDRPGDLPNTKVAASENDMLQATIKQLQLNDQAKYSTAIITKDLYEAQALQDKMQQQNVKTVLIKSENQRLAAGDLIIPAYLAKGLEFDAVIMWNASKNEFNDHEHQLVYTIASRAMHKLTIVADRELNPIIAAVPENLSIRE